MAEAAVMTIVSKVLSTIASSVFKDAYERIRPVADARAELEELGDTIKTIEGVLLDAEKKQVGSRQAKNWIERVKDVMHDFEDLIDTVSIEEHQKEVRVLFSQQNSITPSGNIAKMVEAIRNKLRKLRDDIGQFESDNYVHEMHKGGIRPRDETGSVFGSDDVIGRENELRQIYASLYHESPLDSPVSVIAIVGIAGMGKTSLAQLVYNDAKIKKDFRNMRYWVSVSKLVGEKEILGKIFLGIYGGGQYQGESISDLQSEIKEVLDKKGKFLLVLDDLCDENTARLRGLLSLLSSNKAKGSKIIITTRMHTIPRSMKSDETLELNGLSSEASWDLFEKYAFTKEQKNDSVWISLGRKILSQCVDVPLAIRSIACLLRSKDSVKEWREIEYVELPKIMQSADPIYSSVKLSYDHLPSHLKNCFAYCSLYPRGTEFSKQSLIYVWIAQGFVHPGDGETLEIAGNAYFMELFRRSFFQVRENFYKDECFVMHDLIYDLARCMAGQDIKILTEYKNEPHRKVRHVSIDYEIGESHSSQLSFLEPSRVRSLFFPNRLSCRTQVLCEQLLMFVFLRSLTLGFCVNGVVPDSIGKLNYLRYLNLSHNNFTHLPDSITDLVNLTTLDISCCRELVELPRAIGKLVNLRHLANSDCSLLRMPPSFSELTSLQHLAEFNVIRSTTDEIFCGFDVLARMKLQGKMTIRYDRNFMCSEDGLMLEGFRTFDFLEILEIRDYPGLINPVVSGDLASKLGKLERLELHSCGRVKHLTPLRSIPCLKHLDLTRLPELLYMEDDELVSTANFFPYLQQLHFKKMPSFKGWSRHLINEKFSNLSALTVICCSGFESMPPAPHLKTLSADDGNSELLEKLLSASSHLEHIELSNCAIKSFHGEHLTSLRKLHLLARTELQDVKLAPNVLVNLDVFFGGNLVLRESSINLSFPSVLSVKKLPKYLQCLLADSQLRKRDSDALAPQDPIDYSVTTMVVDLPKSQDEEVLASVMKEVRSTLYLRPKDYEIEKDTLIQLWMAVEPKMDELRGDECFSIVLNKGYLLRCGTNFMTGKDRYRINSHKINELRVSQNDDAIFYLQWDKECHNVDAESIQHASLGYSAEIDVTTFEMLEKFKQLRTLQFIGSRGHKAIQIPSHLFSSFRELQALDLSKTFLKELPNTIGHMVHLRYLDLSWTLIKVLPDIICSTLGELQTLKLIGCLNLRELPTRLKMLTSLRHLDLDVLGQLTTMPRGIGALVNLRTLPAFLVGTQEGCKIQELKGLESLSGSLCIANLEHVKSADEAKEVALYKKMQIEKLELRWTASELSGKHTQSDAVLHQLLPSISVEELRILCYEGSMFPTWFSNPALNNIVSITFYKCENVLELPRLEYLPLLKSLYLTKMNSIKKIERHQGDTAYDVAFFSLEKLEIDEMKSLRSWRWGSCNEDDFSNLVELTISGCPGLEELDLFPHLSAIKHLEVRDCPKLRSLPDTKLLVSLKEMIVEDCPQIKSKGMTKARAAPQIWKAMHTKVRKLIRSPWFLKH